jgi:hypothetical protein
MSTHHAPEPHVGVQPTASTLNQDAAAAGCAKHGRLTPAEAAVVIAVVGAVTALSAAQRPVPAVLVGLCAAAAALLVRLPAACLLGRCAGGQG